MATEEQETQTTTAPAVNHSKMFDNLLKKGYEADFRYTDHEFRNDTRELNKFNGKAYSRYPLDALGCGNKDEESVELEKPSSTCTQRSLEG